MVINLQETKILSSISFNKMNFFYKSQPCDDSKYDNVVLESCQNEEKSHGQESSMMTDQSLDEDF